MNTGQKSKFAKQKKKQDNKLNSLNKEENTINTGIPINTSEKNNVQLNHTTTIIMNQNQQFGQNQNLEQNLIKEEDEDIKEENEINAIIEDSETSNSEERKSIQFEDISDSVSEVIDIEEEQWDWLCNGFPDEDDGEYAIKAIVNGVPLPQGHGRLIDADVFEKRLMSARSYYIGEKTDDFDLRFAAGLKSAAERLVDEPTIIKGTEGKE